MRTPILIVILTVVVLGCARSAQAPVVPGVNPAGALAQSSQVHAGPHRLFGEYSFFINAAHDRVDVVPRREARLHLNALKFLEEYCTDCLQIVQIKNNGDSTIDLTVRLTHPFPGHPEYTGFDVKGIIMFNGSYHLGNHPGGGGYPGQIPVLPDFCIVSWREMGDPEVLNPDGYAYRWSPYYDSGSDLPIFNYWPGQYSNTVPNAGLNAYLDFYTEEQRHIFETDHQKTRTYKIWLPAGKPVMAGYAVEACWEPPTVTPVTDPMKDFPISGNQPEPYRCNLIVNHGEPLLKDEDCCSDDEACDRIALEWKDWNHFPIDPSPYGEAIVWSVWADGDNAAMLSPFVKCKPEQEGLLGTVMFQLNPSHQAGIYRWALGCHDYGPYPYPVKEDWVFDIFDLTVIEK